MIEINKHRKEINLDQYDYIIGTVDKPNLIKGVPKEYLNKEGHQIANLLNEIFPERKILITPKNSYVEPYLTGKAKNVNIIQ